MQQRAAIARALAVNPRILLMDEPCASVDTLTRAGLEDLLLKIHTDLGIAVVLVTHDIDEKVYLADRVTSLGMSPGTAIEEIGIDLSQSVDQFPPRSTLTFWPICGLEVGSVRGPRREADREGASSVGTRRGLSGRSG